MSRVGTTIGPLGCALLGVAAGIFCGRSLAALHGAERVADGVWGGRGVSLRVSEGGASVEYDCAGGSVDEPLALDGEGRFDVLGTHFQERPGPRREDEQPEKQPARYQGRTDGRTMTYTVTLAGTDRALGPYSLTYGAPGMLRKCQ